MSRLTTAITYSAGYVEPGYVDINYTTTSTGESGVKLSHTLGSVSFAKAFKFPQWMFELIQPSATTAVGHPTYYPLVVSQMPFDATFPWMTDAELNALRTWMFTTIPLYDSFDMILFGSNATLRVRFGGRNLKVVQLKKGYNEVTIPFVRV